MMTTHAAHGLRDIDRAAWDRLSAGRGPAFTHQYLSFREEVEPGAPVAAIVSDAEGPLGAVHGVRATARTALFSHPWKMFTKDQFLRLDADASGAAVRQAQSDLVGALAGIPPSRGGRDLDPWELLDRALGEPLVVRAYDTSEIVLSGALSGDQSRDVMRRLVAALQDHEAAIVLPYVKPGDADLKGVLAEAGFVSGTLTAASTFEFAESVSYDAYVAGLPSRVRRHYARDAREVRGENLSVETVPLRDHLDRIVELECQTTRKNGGSADPQRLRRAREFMSVTMADQVRVVTAATDEVIGACAVHLAGRGECCVLAYGADYTLSPTGIAYHYLMLDEPLRFCTGAGLRTYRLGFEAFQPKRQRGANVERRETWLWTRSAGHRQRASDLLRFLSQRNVEYLARFGA